MPSRCSNISALRCFGSISDALSFHSMRRVPAAGSRDSTAAPAPSPKRQALISTPGSLSRYIAALLTSTQTESTCSAAPEAISERASCRFGSAAAQPWPTRSKACTSARRPSRSTT